MLTWLTGQSIAVIAVIVFAAAYLLAAVIIVSLAIASRHGLDHAFKGISGVALGPVSVTFALLVGFLGADVWPTFDRSSSALGVEAARLREALVVADALPENVRFALRRQIREHIDTIVVHEWPAMAARTQTLQGKSAPLHAALIDLLSANLSDGGQRLAQQRAVAAIEEALDARRQRILLSQTTLGGTKVFILVLLAGLVLLMIAIEHAENRGAQIITAAIFATAAAASMFAILVYDRPFGGGGISLSPEILIEVRPD